MNKYVDEVAGTNTTPGEVDSVSPITRRRSFPHIINDFNKISYPTFQANIQTGEASADISDAPIWLRWSDDRGKTWSNPISTSMGLVGEYFVVPQFNQLGMARDRVFELFWSAPVNTALLGAYIEAPRVART